MMNLIAQRPLVTGLLVALASGWQANPHAAEPPVTHAKATPTVRVLRAELQQGGYKLLEVPASSHVTLGGEAVPLVPGPAGQAYALLGFDRLAPAERWLWVCATPTPTAASCHTEKLTLASRTYATQNVRGASRKHVEPEPASLARMQADNRAIGAARQAKAAAATRGEQAAGLGFTEQFRRPSPGRTTGVFGSQRLFDGKERSWHKGIDYAAPMGTPVVAPAGGLVRLARETFMSGNLVMVDHGANLSTLYAHLDSMTVTPGQVVQAGDQLGTVGTTGRSSGPHLHWGMYVGTTAIDPALWLADQGTARVEDN